MGKPTPAKKGRNRDLIRDWLSGNFTTVDLVRKYRITSTRIYQIINREKQKPASLLPIDKSLE